VVLSLESTCITTTSNSQHDYGGDNGSNGGEVKGIHDHLYSSIPSPVNSVVLPSPRLLHPNTPPLTLGQQTGFGQ